jgi:hypothetical protein
LSGGISSADGPQAAQTAIAIASGARAKREGVGVTPATWVAGAR